MRLRRPPVKSMPKLRPRTKTATIEPMTMIAETAYQ
jgi:hypothetical protein